jgi:UDP-glucose 4-epimerase
MSSQPIFAQRILITGGAGLVGSHIADLALAEGAEHILILDNFTRGRIDNLTSALSTGRVEIVEGDIRDTALLASLMPRADVVFHQAAIRITQCAEEPRLALDVLATGTFNVLEAAVAARVRKVVAASSASVYGLASHFPTTELDHPYDNRTIYGAAKLFDEGLLRSFHAMYGLPYVALRYFNVYGPRMDIHGAYTEVLIRWMERIAAGLPPLIFGDGLQTMDFVHVHDIARANILAAKSNITDEVFNVASGTETSLLDLAHALMRVMGAALPIEHRPERAVNPVPRRLASTEKARGLLDFQSRIPLEDGLRQLVSWWRDSRASAGGPA